MSREVIDYEKKFEEDLERAQALSLESLALDQFKNKKLLELSNQTKSKNVSVSRASSMTETDASTKYEQTKSRPRPGTSTCSLNRSLLAPPPQRKTSLGVDSPDLISFSSAPATTNNTIIELCNLSGLNSGSIGSSSTNQINLQNVNYGSHISFVPHQYPLHLPQVWFKHAQPNGQQGTRQIITNIQRTEPPMLPPKNERKPPPPLALPSSRSVTSSTSSLSRQRNHSASNLIDLAPSNDENDHNSVRVSILQEFDPILSLTPTIHDPQMSHSFDDSMSVCDSEYDVYDPYDLYTGSGNTSLSDSIYHATAPQSPPPPLPPRPYKSPYSKPKTPPIQNKVKNLKDCVKKRRRDADADLCAFYTMVVSIRKQYNYNDPDTNMGFVISPMVSYQYQDGVSIKLCVYPDFEGADRDKPVNFTCDVSSSIEHITLQLTCDLEAPTKDKYTLKVFGCNEYLAPTSFLSDYEYVHNCIKLDEDILLTLIPDSKVDKSFARTQQDDNRDRNLAFEDVVSDDSTAQVNYEKVVIVLEAIEKEIKSLENQALQLQNYQTSTPLQPTPFIQSVRCAVNIIGCLATTDIMTAIANLFTRSKQQHVDNLYEDICSIGDEIRQALLNIIELYSTGFNADFEVDRPISNKESPKYIQDIVDPLAVRLCSIYRPSSEWKHDSYLLAVQMYHGHRPIGHPVLSDVCAKTDQDHWPSRITFDCFFEFFDHPISSLAREAWILFVLYGRNLETQENNDNNQEPRYKQEEVGWASSKFFDYEGVMIQGPLLLSLWPPKTQFLHGSPPTPGTHPHPDHPLLELQIHAPKVQFSRLDDGTTSKILRGDFNSLDLQTQQQLLDICEQDMLMKLPTEYREVLWEKRHYLYHIPEALPKVLLAARNWEYACLADLHGMLKAWKPLKPIHALQLLMPSFPDLEVRKMAVRRLNGLSSDELIDYIPQLVVALRHELYENSPLVHFILERSLKSPRFAHHLFWLLSRTLPGNMPQNFNTNEEEDWINLNEVRHHRRVKLILRALLAICGEALRNNFLTQQFLVKELDDVADAVKKSKDNHRLTALHNGLSIVHANLTDNPASLPLSPTLRVSGVQIRTSFYFPSNTLPLKINFLAADGSTTLPAIYKAGDDLQQDMLTLQVVRLMDKLWLNEGLDLKMVSFICVATGHKRGMIEMVTNAETLRKIQVEHGLTGSFKDKPIAEWLAKHNPSELEYGRAVENFTASCAGYCVVTYILGICDRHNDNIMLKTSGHLFHIDFGKFLGDAQMFGNFKRDRTPFVLTSDMAYVINGGDRPSEKFHKFVDLCCLAFNIIRSNANLFLYIFTLMASSGICGMTPESVSYLHKALLPNMSNPEAAAFFARLIESSLKSWFTQFNFFLHNLAQLKFTNDHDDSEGSLLSFVPKIYTRSTDGRLVHVKVVSYKKRYDPVKYYVYVLRVYRAETAGYMEIQRTYKEFCELHQKLCIYFPLAKLHSLSTGLHVGRSNIKQVAEKRFHDVSLFIMSLFRCAEEIAHSDLVYTFFHPLLRDQQDLDEFGSRNRQSSDVQVGSGILKGQLKLSFQYHKGVFSVMVYHVRGLPLLANGQEPSTYVKVYLLPDLKKTTKRKTKVVKRNCHPSFVEMLEYRMNLDIVVERHLQATVWNYDALQENEFLGGVELELSAIDDLTKETIEWYPLVNLSR